MTPPAPQITVVAPVYNEAGNLAAFHRRLIASLDLVTAGYEVIYVDDGSEDGSSSIIEAFIEEEPRVRLLEFSRNFGKEFAVLAGYDEARGDAVVVLDSDLQHPPELIGELVEKWRQGAEIVDAVRRGYPGHSLFRRMANRGFYWLLEAVSKTSIPDDISDFRLLDRRVVNALCRCRERFRFNKGLICWLGFRRESVPFSVERRPHGKTRWSTLRLVRYAMDAIFSFSALPLRFAGICGLLVSIASFLYLIALVVDNLVAGLPMPGYATVAGGIFLLGGVILLGMWLLGEYVGRMFEEIKCRPLYVLRRVVGHDSATHALTPHDVEAHSGGDDRHREAPSRPT